MKEGVKLNKKIGLFLAAAALAMTISGCSGSEMCIRDRTRL